ncbi:pyridoxal-phosphate dependent enzyme, partial [Candidatus Bathyarchaeota archaeon]|nr:pyridoxal-phosphate dependent enzyme [Candidatus Bathyarchaeota archaeon]
MKEKRASAKVGSTPTVYNEFLKCFLKLECNNPSGSHKDRETFYFINKFGWEKKYIVASSGNAGISLAYWMREKAVVLV